MPRAARIVEVGYPHHVVQRGNNRQTVFFDDKDRQLYLYLLKKYSAESPVCNINAFCLMNNHVHILATPQNENSLAKTMQKLNLAYTLHINKKYERTGRLWESRFHSCLVDKETYLWTVCRYIERNPVRAGMVSEPTQYKWSSARVNSSLRSEHDFVELIWEQGHEHREYSRFLNQPDNETEIERIRKATFGERNVLGTDKFLKHIAEKLRVITAPPPRGRPRKTKKSDLSLFL